MSPDRRLIIFDKYAEFIDRGANLLIEIYDKLPIRINDWVSGQAIERRMCLNRRQTEDN